MFLVEIDEKQILALNSIQLPMVIKMGAFSYYRHCIATQGNFRSQGNEEQTCTLLDTPLSWKL